MTTLIGLVGMTPWLLIAAHRRRAALLERLRRHKTIGWGLLMLAAGGAIALVQTGIVGDLLEMAQLRPLWAQSGKFHVYHWIFLKYYPTFWALLPLASLYAIARKGEPALFCCSLFIVSLFLHLFFSFRGERYIAYLMPFFFALWGIVLAEMVPELGRTAAAALGRVIPGLRLSEGAGRTVQGLTVTVSIAFLLVCNSAFFNAGKVMLRGPVHLHPQYQVDWSLAREVLGPLAQASDVVIATNGLAATYHLGGFDVEFSATHLSEVEGGEQFSIDRRTGRPIISEAQSLWQLMACYPTGLVISEGWQWKNRIVGIDEASAALLVQAAELVELPPEAKLIAYQWRQAEGGKPREGWSADGCRALLARLGGVYRSGTASPPGSATKAG